MEAKHPMNKLLVSYGLFVVLSVGFLSFANAEEMSVDIDHPVSEMNCERSDMGALPRTICIFVAPQDEDNPVVWDFKDEKWTTVEELEKEAKEEYEKLMEEQPIVVEPTYWESQLERLKESDKDTATGSELRQTLNDFIGAQCFRGLLDDGTAAFQTFGAWDIPTEEFIDPMTGEKKIRIAKDYDIESVDLKGLLGKIDKLVEECIAQGILAGNTSPSYRILAIGDIDPQTYHSDLAQDIPTWSQSRVNEESNMNMISNDVTRQGNDPICNGYYSHQMKLAYGCADTFNYESFNPAPVLQDYIDNPVYKKFAQYDNGDYSHQLEQVKQRNLEKYMEKHR